MLCAPQSEKYKSYIQMIREVSSQPGNTYTTRVYQDEQATVHGLYVSETLAAGTMGLYCAVSSKRAPGITEWMDYDFFHQLYREGVHTLYLGGSETRGVDSYVKKLLPTEPSYLLQPLYLPNRREPDSSLFGEYNGVEAQKE